MTLGAKSALLVDELAERGLLVSDEDGKQLSGKAIYNKTVIIEKEARRYHQNIHRSTAAEDLSNLLKTPIGGRSVTDATASHRAGRDLS